MGTGLLSEAGEEEVLVVIALPHLREAVLDPVPGLLLPRFVEGLYQVVHRVLLRGCGGTWRKPSRAWGWNSLSSTCLRSASIV